MKIRRTSRDCLAVVALLAYPHLAGAQAINYQILNSSAAVPTLGSLGLVLLSMLLLGGAVYFHRQAKSKHAKLMSLIMGMLGLGLAVAKHDVIRDAVANGGFLAGQFLSGQTVVQLGAGVGTYEITNNSGSTIQITGFTGEGDSCGVLLGQRQDKIHLAALDVPLADLGIKLAVEALPSSAFHICPHGAATCPNTPLPGCSINSQVAPGQPCYVTLTCALRTPI